MIWRYMNLRTRILLGYGLILVLAAALALFLLLRIGALNGRIKQINDSVVEEASIGTRVVNLVDTTQRAVERYLRAPQQSHYQEAYAALQELAAELKSDRNASINSTQRERMDDMSQRLVTYQNTFQSLDSLVKAQSLLQARLNSHLSRSAFLLNSAIVGNIRSGTTNL